MFVKQFVDAGLGNSSYLVGSEESGVAVAIDPARDADLYIGEAAQRGVRITYILETHLHADFVSGSRELEARTGAVICAGARAGLQYDHRPVREGDVIEAAGLRFRVVETPGHSPEHVSYLVVDPGDRPLGLFSGGAIIVGGAARTDLLGHEHTEALTHSLFHTMREKLAPLPDEVEVYPTHGAGSFCAAPAGQERVTTIGAERRYNTLFQTTSEETFMRRAVEGLSSYPEYFKRLRGINQRGPRILGGIPELAPLKPREVRRRMDQGALVVDSRPGPVFAACHIPESYGAPLRGAFASWVGWVVPPDRSLILVSAGPETHHEIARQLAGIGYDDLPGYLEGGVEAWLDAGYPVTRIPVWSVSDLKEAMASPKPPLLVDVRQDSEWNDGHIHKAVHIEGGSIQDEADALPRDRTIAVHCGSHQRSVTALSVLERKGFKDLVLVRGGWGAWVKAGYDVEQP